ncbi:MAG: PASTA domain-containing protein [Treponema sp.]|jgi:beta-lactam-binding protein with PASTA domain|nr:PASTA domain-containing protein [Treponema sp.]
MGTKLNFSSVEDYVANHLRLFIFSTAGLLLIVGIIAVSVFFIAVRGEEQTMVPDVRGKEITEALMELQVKELYPRLQLRYSLTSKDKGLIIEQEPMPGTIVKAGRRIRLVVSMGVIINKVENFIGREVDEVRMDLQTLYSSSGGLPLLSLKEPMMYDFSQEKPGTILAQKPEPGTDISGPLTLEFVVSRGPERRAVDIPQLTGLSLAAALDTLGSAGFNFSFSIRERNADEQGETIVSQRPAANTSSPANTVVQLTLTYPEYIADNEVFGIFSHKIPANPYPLSVRLEAILPSGDRTRLITINYIGGDFSVPYKLPAGTVLILSMLNRELYRETVIH